VKANIADIRQPASALGRDPRDVKAFIELNVVTAKTEAAARAKLEDYRKYGSIEASLALLSGWMGTDLSKGSRRATGLFRKRRHTIRSRDG